MTDTYVEHSYNLNRRVIEYYINKDPNLSHIYTCKLREPKSMNFYIMDIYITRQHKIEIIHPESYSFEELISIIDEEIDMCKLLGIKDG